MQTIGPYEIIERIATGPMSDVYAALDPRLDLKVALKLGKTDPSDPNYDVAKERFQRESRLLAQVDHPALVNVKNSGLTPEGQPWIALEWIEGPALAATLKQQPRLNTRRALTIARQLASALAAIHAKGFIHSDIKPENVILQNNPDLFEPPQAKLMDLGVAGELLKDTGHTQIGVLIGTPQYMAPEQLRAGALSPATDIWQLGILLFQMLTGTRPFDGKNTYGLMTAIMTETPQIPADLHLSPQLTAFLLRTLDKDPTLRPANGTEAEAILTAIQPPSQDINYVGGETAPDLSAYLPPSQPIEATPTPEPTSAIDPTDPFGAPLPAHAIPPTHNPATTLYPITVPAPAAQPQFNPFPAPSGAASAPKSASLTLPLTAIAAVLVVALAVAYFFFQRPTAAPPGHTSSTILAANPWLGVLFGIALALLGLALGRTVRKLLASREHALSSQAKDLLSGTRDQSHLSQTLAIQVDELVAKCRLVDEKILGMTMAVMVTEYSTATAFDDRQKALMNAVTLLDKLMPKLSPWYVRHDKLVALCVTLTVTLTGLAATAINVVKLVQNK